MAVEDVNIDGVCVNMVAGNGRHEDAVIGFTASVHSGTHIIGADMKDVWKIIAVGGHVAGTTILDASMGFGN